MSRYGSLTTETRECVETKKNLKAAIKVKKRILNDFIEITNTVDMDWNAKQAAIGSMYIDIKNMKSRLKRK